MRSFDGATVVVTGAAAGLGRALCGRFGRAGARIVALDRDAAGLARLAAELRSMGTAVIALDCDVTDEAACRRAIDAGVAQSGGIDLLVCNAGISHHGEFARTLPDVIRRVMAVNFFGAVHCTHAALPGLLARRGMIVAISSVAGFAPLLGRTGYAASKHAMFGFFDSLRIELAGSGVSVTLVAPDFVVSEIHRRAAGPDGRPLGESPMQESRIMTAEDCARIILRAAARRERLALTSTRGRLVRWAGLLAPGLLDRLAARAIRERR